MDLSKIPLLMDTARNNGLKTTLQMKLFLSCCYNESHDITSVIGLQPKQKGYKVGYSVIQKLVEMELIYYCNNSSVKTKLIRLTDKGKTLYSLLKSL